MDKDLEKRVIEAISVVSSVSFVAGDKTHKADFYVNLRYSGTSSLEDVV